VPTASHAAMPAADAKGVAPAAQQGPTPSDGATGH